MGIRSAALSWYRAKVVTRVVVWSCVALSESLVGSLQLACLRSENEGSWGHFQLSLGTEHQWQLTEKALRLLKDLHKKDLHLDQKSKSLEIFAYTHTDSYPHTCTKHNALDIMKSDSTSEKGEA